MTSAYFAPLVSLPMIITKPGLYRTRAGEVVKVYTVSTSHDYGCVGMYIESQILEHWHKSGRLYSNMQSENDIVSEE